MKKFQCRLMGVISSGECFECYNMNKHTLNFPSRVLCKRENVTEEVNCDELIEVDE